jgi:hypothetical protein
MQKRGKPSFVFKQNAKTSHARTNERVTVYLNETVSEALARMRSDSSAWECIGEMVNGVGHLLRG